MKKLISLLLAFVAVATLAACSNGKDSAATTSGAINEMGGGGENASGEGNNGFAQTLAPTAIKPTPSTSSNGGNPAQAGDEILTATASPDSPVGILSRFSSKDLSGNTVDSGVFIGKKLTMVNVWATFCGPCINEMPDIAKINNEYADKGFQVVGIVSDASCDYYVSTAKDIVASTGATYVNLVPSSTLNSAILNSVQYVPTTIFVDEYGVQVGQTYIGSKTKAEWSSIIDGLLANM